MSRPRMVTSLFLLPRTLSLSILLLLLLNITPRSTFAIVVNKNNKNNNNAQNDEIQSIPGQGPLLSKNYAGYVTATTMGELKEAYYYIIESENNPYKDPVLLWETGGPGCSSLLGLFTEIGPYTFRLGGLAKNEYRWTTNATIIFIDSPAGVGFSKDPIGPLDPWGDAKTSEYNYNALRAIFNIHSKFKGLPFYIVGESYGGHYAPQLAERIYDGPDMVLKASMNGWMVGNPCTGDIGCNNPDPTLIPFFKGRGFLPISNRFTGDLQDASFDAYDVAVPVCLKGLEMMVTGGGYNQSHFNGVRREIGKRKLMSNNNNNKNNNNNNNIKAPPKPYGPCAQDLLTQWLNRYDVKAAIHADLTINYNPCANLNYNQNDVQTSVVPIYQKLMDNTNWKIMIYSGAADSVVNFLQTQTVIMGMNRNIIDNVMRPWNYEDVYNTAGRQLGGFYLLFDRISWASVRGAGHMVPQYNPPAGKELLNSFLAMGRPGRL